MPKIPIFQKPEEDLVNGILSASAITRKCDSEQEQSGSMLLIPEFHRASVVS